MDIQTVPEMATKCALFFTPASLGNFYNSYKQL